MKAKFLLLIIVLITFNYSCKKENKNIKKEVEVEEYVSKYDVNYNYSKEIANRQKSTYKDEFVDNSKIEIDSSEKNNNKKIYSEEDVEKMLKERMEKLSKNKKEDKEETKEITNGWIKYADMKKNGRILLELFYRERLVNSDYNFDFKVKKSDILNLEGYVLETHRYQLNKRNTMSLKKHLEKSRNPIWFKKNKNEKILSNTVFFRSEYKEGFRLLSVEFTETPEIKLTIKLYPYKSMYWNEYGDVTRYVDLSTELEKYRVNK